MERVLALEYLTDFAADRFDVSEVELPIAQAGRAYAQKRNLGLHHGSRRVACGMQAASLIAFGDHLRDLRLHDRALARLHGADFDRTQVHADHTVAFAR